MIHQQFSNALLAKIFGNQKLSDSHPVIPSLIAEFDPSNFFLPYASSKDSWFPNVIFEKPPTIVLVQSLIKRFADQVDSPTFRISTNRHVIVVRRGICGTNIFKVRIVLSELNYLNTVFLTHENTSL
jgi:hypothetical protein